MNSDDNGVPPKPPLPPQGGRFRFPTKNRETDSTSIDDDDDQLLTESSIIEMPAKSTPPPPPSATSAPPPPPGTTMKGFTVPKQTVPMRPAPTPPPKPASPSLAKPLAVPSNGGFVRLPTSVRQRLSDDVGLEQGLELDPALGDFIAQYDGELAASDPGPSTAAARLHLAIARMLEVAGLPEAALVRYQAAHGRDPKSIAAIRELRRIARSRKDWDDVLELLEAEANLASSPKKAAALIEERARILRHFRRDQEALAAFAKALSLDPERVSALEASRTVEVRAGRWDRVVEILLALADRNTDVNLEMAHRQLAAEITEHTLGDKERAVDLYVRALELVPSHRAALDGALRLLIPNGRWNEVQKLLIAQGQASADPQQQYGLYVRAGFVAAEHTHDSQSAVWCLEAAHQLEPRDPLPLQVLVELYRRTPGAWQKLDESYQRLLKLCLDPVQRAGLLMERVNNLLEHSDSPDVVIEVLVRFLDEQPTHLRARTTLQSLLVRQGRLDEYIRLTWRAANQHPSADVQAYEWVSLGQFCELHARLDDALNAYRRVLELDPTEITAFRGVERLLRRRADFPALAQLYRVVIDATASAERKAALLFSLATLFDGQLEDSAAAIDALERYRKLKPHDLSAVWMLQRLHGQNDAWAEYRDALQVELDLTKEPQQRAQLKHQIAAVLETIGNRDDVVRTYNDAILEFPQYRPSHERLVVLHRQSAAWRELVGVLEAKLAWVPAVEKANLLVDIAEVRETQLGELAAAERDFESALSFDPRHLQAFAGLERLHLHAKSWQKLREVLERQLNPDMPPRRRAGTLTRIGMILAERFGEFGEAELALTRALEAQPNYAPATQLIERIYGQTGRWDALAKRLYIALGSEEHIDTRAQVAYRYGSLLSWRLRHPQEAVQPFELALAVAPDLAGIRLSLSILFNQLGQYQEAADLIYEHAKKVSDVPAAVSMFKEAADLQGFALKADSRRQLHRVLLHAPLDLMAIDRLEALCTNRSELADLWQRRLQDPEGDEFVELRLALAEVISASHAETAYQLLQEAVTQGEGHLPALRMAANSAFASSKFEAACGLREKEAEVVLDVRTKVAALLAAAHIARDQLGQFDRARQTLKSAIKFAPERADIYEMLAELCVVDKLWEPMAEVLRCHIDAITPNERAPRLMQLVELQRDRLGNPAEATKSLREALELDPNPQPALVALAELEVGQEHWAEAVEAYQSALALPVEDPKKDYQWRTVLATILLDQLARPNDAELVLNELIEQRPRDTPALSMLARLYQNQGRLSEASSVLDKLALASLPGDAAKVHIRLAKIALATEQKDQVMEHLRATASLIRKDVNALDPLIKWADEQADYGPLAELLEEVLMAIPSNQMDIIVPVRLALASVLAGKLDNRADAEREARMAANSAPKNVDAQLAAARLQIERAEARRFALAALEIDPFCFESYEIIRKGFDAAHLVDAVGRCSQVLVVLGEQSPDVLRSADDAATHSGNPQAPLGREGMLQYLTHPKLPEWGRELLIRAGTKAQIFVLQTVPTYACPDEHPIRAQAYRTAAIFGVADFELGLTSAPGVTAVIDPEKPTRLVAGPLACSAGEAEMRYHIGVGLTPMLLGTELLELLDDRDFLRLLQGLIGLAYEGYGEAEVVKQLTKFMPRRNRKAVVEYAKTFDPRTLRLDLGDWRRALAITARRAGLLASRDVRAAVNGLLKSAEVQGAKLDTLRSIPDSGDLLSFAVSDPYARVRRQLGMNQDSPGRDGA